MDEYDSWVAFHEKLYREAGELGPIADKIRLELKIPNCLKEYSTMVLIQFLEEAYNLGLKDAKNLIKTMGNTE